MQRFAMKYTLERTPAKWESDKITLWKRKKCMANSVFLWTFLISNYDFFSNLIKTSISKRHICLSFLPFTRKNPVFLLYYTICSPQHRIFCNQCALNFEQNSLCVFLLVFFLNFFFFSRKHNYFSDQFIFRCDWSSFLLNRLAQ